MRKLLLYIISVVPVWIAFSAVVRLTLSNSLNEAVVFLTMAIMGAGIAAAIVAAARKQ